MPAFGAGVLLILIAGAIPLLLRTAPRLADAMFALFMLAGCTVAAVSAVRVLLGETLDPVVFSTTLPGGAWVAGLDALSAWFVLLLCAVTAAAAGFGATYLARERGHYNVPASHALFALLTAAMLGVLTAQAVLPFMLAWEVMAVSAYFLIVFEHHRGEVRRAGLTYLIVTHTGTLALLVMFLLWGRGAADLSFHSLTPDAARLVLRGAPVLLLGLIGFGAKAGIFPLHFWLPGAHASAPSHVSAVLSGVMIKTGMYGLFRILTLFGTPPAWWGWLLLVLGSCSAVLSVRWALGQHDFKRALAYSSVDNIGITVLGLGLGVLGAAYHLPVLTLLGFAGALLHILNHALFKSLLFLGAGAIVHATGTREIDRLGGLSRRMPRTAVAFIVGSVAIAGIPGLNGFVGEWTLIRGFLTAGGSTGTARIAGLGAAAIGLVAALTLACFLRLFTALFLGTPRAEDITAAADAPGGMTVALAGLAAACLAIGLAPAIALIPARRVVSMLVRGNGPVLGLSEPVAVPAAGISLLAGALVGVAALVWVVRRVGGRAIPVRTEATWGCAYPAPTPRMQYTAASFSAPLTRLLAGGRAQSGRSAPDVAGTDRDDWVLHQVAMPVWRWLRRLAAELRPLQHGRVTTYLQLMIGTVLLLLGFLFFAGAGVSQ